MPKMKTNRTAKKKFRANAKGKLKKAQAFTNHNTSKRGPKRRRRLRKIVAVDKTNLRNVRGQLPYLMKGL